MIICTTPESTTHRPLLQRAVAVCFVVLYLLAAMRGLAPGLCLNLRTPERLETGVVREAPTRMAAISCCVVGDGGAGDPAPAAPERCPFCRLALGLTEPPDFVYFVPVPDAGFPAHFLPPATWIPRDRDPAHTDRGPPFFPAV